MEILGIDIGGSGIKGAVVDTSKGELLGDRYRLPTPQPARPQVVAKVVGKVTRHFAWSGPIGCTFPAVIKDGVAYTAANVDKAWIGTDARGLLHEHTDCPLVLLNDADAAGIAEMTFGAGKEQRGVVLLLTFGTGIGSALFVDGCLAPNTELGHLEIRGKEAEHRAANSARKREKLSWKQWGKRVNEYLDHLEFLFSPDLLIISGGVSKKHAKYFPFLNTRAPVVPAQMLNEAGIIGAALTAQSLALEQAS